MKMVSIQNLKAILSAAVSEAESGETITITRHNRPVAELGPPETRRAHQPKKAGNPGIKPALKKPPTGGRYLKILLEDRGDR